MRSSIPSLLRDTSMKTINEDCAICLKAQENPCKGTMSFECFDRTTISKIKSELSCSNLKLDEMDEKSLKRFKMRLLHLLSSYVNKSVSMTTG